MEQEQPIDEQQLNLFHDLRKSIKKGQYEKALEACNQIRSKSPHDPVAVQCKVQSLMHLGRTAKALELAGSPKYRDFLAIERAYCQYELGQLHQALATCREALEKEETEGRRNEGLLHLKAQILYKLGEFSQAADCYKVLTEEHPDPETAPELHANAYAAHCAAQRAEEALTRHPPQEFATHLDLEDPQACNGHAYELFYNTACALAQAGRHQEAKDALISAQDACKALLDAGDIDEEEHAAEMDVIRTELGFVLAQLGETDAALKACKAIFKNKSADPQLSAVATNNFAILKKDKDMKEALKRVGSGLPEGSEARLFPNQLEQLRLNQCLLLLAAGPTKKATLTRELEEFEQSCPHSDTPLLLRTAIDLRGKEGGEECDARLEEALERVKGTSREVPVLFFKAQILIKRGDLAGAVETLQQIQDPTIAHAPGMVGTKAALYTRLGRGKEASNALEEVVTQVDQLAIAEEAKAALLLGVARYRLDQGLYSEAANALENLLNSETGSEMDPDARLGALASLVKAYSWIDLEQAELRAATLPGLEVEEDFDPDELEQTELPRSHRMQKLVGVSLKDTQKSKKRINLRKIMKKRVKAKEKYLAKLEAEGKYDPNRPIKVDPERWLPRKQRSYGKRGRRRNKFVGAQGAGDGGAKDAARLDAFARAQAKREKEEQKLKEKKVDLPSNVGRRKKGGKGGRRR